jgi:hypothetical protein
MPPELSTSDDCNSDVIPGRVVQQSSYHADRGMLVDLQG